MSTTLESAARAVVPPLHLRQLSIGDQFSKLTPFERLYAHYLGKAAWLGARIIFDQVSPESARIFELIMELQRCGGKDWMKLLKEDDGDDERKMLNSLRCYAATFLANVGNYYGRGDQKFVPNVPEAFLIRVASVSEKATTLLKQCMPWMLSCMPSSLGFPRSNGVAQSSYYPHTSNITAEELQSVTEVLRAHGIGEENTRVRKVVTGEPGNVTYEVLVASVQSHSDPEVLSTTPHVLVFYGDHGEHLAKISACLSEAESFASNDIQRKYIQEYRRHFHTGDLNAHKDSQRTWVTDRQPVVEMMMGFVEPYRDPYGTRAEWEGIVAVVDKDKTTELKVLAERSGSFIKTLPWVRAHKGEGFGPWEKAGIELPDFTAIHALAYCSSIIFLGINLPNYDDVRQTTGYKNVMIANRNPLPSAPGSWTPADAPFVGSVEREKYLISQYHASYIHVAIHELLGHGTGRLLVEESSGKYNFDIQKPPVNPLTGKPVTTWYKMGQTWTSVFGGLATSMEECRAECVGTYLITEKELLSIFGHTDNSIVTADEIIYNDYLSVGVNGLRALENYIADDHKWGQAHSRGHFAILRSVLAENGFMTLEVDEAENQITIHVDRTKIFSHGRKAIENLLLKLHILRCTADVDTGREWYEALTKVDEYWAKVRNIVLKNKGKTWMLVQANTEIVEGDVVITEYEPTVEGMIKSWAAREI